MLTPFTELAAGATFDPSKVYRYHLWRDWTPPPDAPRRLCWIMLNPSTADDWTDDPTIRRCQGFARAWGYTGVEIVNLFALRSTDPRVLERDLGAAVGPENDLFILAALQRCTKAVAAWGAFNFAIARAAQVRQLARGVGQPLLCLGLTKQARPKHPLYVPARTIAVPYV